MPMKFAYVCDLLENLENLERGNVPCLSNDKVERKRDILKRWFDQHRRIIDNPNADNVALLSTLLPQRRTDRVYGLRETGLARALAPCLGLGTERARRLREWENAPGRPDFATLAETIVKEHQGIEVASVTVEEVDDSLKHLAATCRFSSPAIRGTLASGASRHQRDILSPLLARLTAREMKWFIRLLLKNLDLHALHEQDIAHNLNPRLPGILKVLSSFEAAIEYLRKPDPADIHPLGITTGNALLSPNKTVLSPKLGVKVGRPTFLKARSIAHCLQIMGASKWHVEPKYDGEYCQIHIDLRHGKGTIQIFSKSGKDSTADKSSLHACIKQSLRIGSNDCHFKSCCILEGEMVVFDKRDNSILPFHKIRKHCPRSGSLLGVEMDSQTQPFERLGIIYYDVLLIDEEPILTKPYSVRRDRLRSITRKSPGHFQRSDWGDIDARKYIDRPQRVSEKLQQSFARAMAMRCEGLVLKPSLGSYLKMPGQPSQSSDGLIIKLKADYIPGLGDCADFAVVGALFRHADNMSKKLIDRLKYTHFVIGCLLNKEEMISCGARPRYKAMSVLTRPCIPEEAMLQLSHQAQLNAVEVICNKATAESTRPKSGIQGIIMPDLHFDYEPATLGFQPQVLFKEPQIVEVLGSAFEKPPSAGYFMLRHARITKIHHDRLSADVISFQELQDLARQALTIPANLQEEEARCLRRLQAVAQRKRPRYVCDTSPFATRSRNSTSTTTSPSKSSSKPVVPLLTRIDSHERFPGENEFAFASPRKRRRTEEDTSSRIEDVCATSADPSSNLNSTAQARPLTDVSSGSHRNNASNGMQEAKASRRTKLSSPGEYLGAYKGKVLWTPLDGHDTPVEFQPSPFTDYSIYLSPCVANIPFLKEDMLKAFAPQHVTTSLEDWIRDVSLGANPFGSEVAESQAFPGLKKAVLVESKRRKATNDIIHAVMDMRLTDGERIEVWDWRVFEDLYDSLADGLRSDSPSHDCLTDAIKRRRLVGRVTRAKEEEIDLMQQEGSLGRDLILRRVAQGQEDGCSSGIWNRLDLGDNGNRRVL